MQIDSMPYSQEAEDALVGCALLDPATAVSVANTAGMNSDWLYTPANRLTWEAVRSVYDERGTADAIMVADAMRVSGNLDKAGGLQRILSTVESLPTAAHLGHYLDIVRSKAKLRGIIERAREAEYAARTEDDPDAVIAKAVDGLFGLTSGSATEKTNADVMDGLLSDWDAARAGGKPAVGLDTPWEGFTELVCGVETGITIIAGRPGSGKTTLEDQLTCWTAAKGVGVGRITLDTTRERLLQRAICREADVSLTRLKYGHYGPEARARVVEASRRIGGWPMFISDRVRDVRGICSTIRGWHTRHNIGMATVDYIGLVESPEMGGRSFDANTRITRVSSALKSLSLELKIPLVVLSQLNRAVEKEGRDPRISDLRDSGSIEQDAFKVVFLYPDRDWVAEREEMHPGSTKARRMAFFDVLKNGDGQTGRIPVDHVCDRFQFDEIAQKPVKEANDDRETF